MEKERPDFKPWIPIFAILVPLLLAIFACLLSPLFGWQPCEANIGGVKFQNPACQPSPTPTPALTPTLTQNEMFAQILAEARAWKALLQDDFVDNGAGWGVESEMENDPNGKGANMRQILPQEGVYRWELVTGSAETYLVTLPAKYDGLENFYISTSVRSLRPGNTLSVGLAFRAQDSGNMYVFWLFADERMTFSVQQNAQRQAPLVNFCANPEAVLPLENYNRLEVVAFGSSYWLYINGQFACQQANDLYPRGKVGLVVRPGIKDQETWVEFDHFELRIP